MSKWTAQKLQHEYRSILKWDDIQALRATLVEEHCLLTFFFCISLTLFVCLYVSWSFYMSVCHQCLSVRCKSPHSMSDCKNVFFPVYVVFMTKWGLYKMRLNSCKLGKRQISLRNPPKLVFLCPVRSVPLLHYTVSPKWPLRQACAFNQQRLTEWLMPLSTSQTLVSALLVHLLPASLLLFPLPRSLLADHLSHYNMMQLMETQDFRFEFLLLNTLIQPPLSSQLFLSCIHPNY